MKRIKFLWHISLFIALFISSCQYNKTSMEEKINTLFQEYHEEYLKMFPLDASWMGDKRYNDTLPNSISESFRLKTKEFYTSYKSKLLQFDRNSLDLNRQLSYDILMWQCEISLEGLNYPTHLTPIDQFWSLNLSIGQMASGKGIQPFKTVDDYENWLKRVDDYLVWCDTAIANMKKGIIKNYVLPKSLILKVIPQIEKFAIGPAEKHIFYGPIHNFPEELSQKDRSRLSATYKNMIVEKVIPKYTELASFFKNEYLPHGRETSGIWDIADTSYYQYVIKYNTTTDLTANEIFEIGQKEVKRILAEMIKLKDSVGFKGDIKEFFAHVKEKQELMPFTEANQVIDYFNGIHNKMKPKLNLLFDLVPNTTFEVRRTEAFREKTASAEYNPGSLDGSRPGIFYVPIPDVKKYNVYSDEDLFLHEAIPGHHYQVSLQQENNDLPEFRKLFWNSSFGEGWSLYCESLGSELGLYTDPYQYFGMLSAEMHRAVRLVVDVGMHVNGWTREEAIQFSLEHEADTESSIVSEIERYMANPGQALSYKIGQIKILELREKAEKELGEGFDIKLFHNELLNAGCLPLFLMEEKIIRWIENSRENT